MVLGGKTEGRLKSADRRPKQIVAAEELIEASDIALRDQIECQVRTQELELRLRRVEGLSTALITEQPGWVEMSKRYIHWYQTVEGLIKSMLSDLGIEVVSLSDDKGRHTHHEDILEELSQPQNPLFELLGRDDILFLFRQAKDDRNVMRGIGKSYVISRPAPDWNAFASRIRSIEKSLWATVAFFKLECSRRKQHARTFAEKEQQLDEWENNLHAEQQSLENRESKIQQEEERLRSEDKKIEDTKDRKAREEEKLRNEAATKKQLAATLKKELKVQEDKLKKAQADLAEQEKKAMEAGKQLKTKTQLTKDNEKLKKDLRDAKTDRPEVVKMETKLKNQAAEIRRLEEKARDTDQAREDAIECCGKQMISLKESFRGSLAKMREADAAVAKAELVAKEEELKIAHQDEVDRLTETQLDEILSRNVLLENYKERINILEEQVAVQDRLLEETKAIKNLQDARVQELNAQYHALQEDLERVRGLLEASDSKRRRLFFF
ncbi:hypothetical protein P7C71_g4130, partial [Lecanoromycetidae sp. Uapishka_2]